LLWIIAGALASIDAMMNASSSDGYVYLIANRLIAAAETPVCRLFAVSGYTVYFFYATIVAATVNVKA